MNRFLDGYVEALFFTEAGPDDDIPGDAELSQEAYASIATDCANFKVKAESLLTLAYDSMGYDEAQAGRDFLLSRNGHGTGFWDRSQLPDSVAMGLTEIAKSFGECDPYCGDDGLVYLD